MTNSMESALVSAEPAYDTSNIRGLLGMLDKEVSNLQAVFGDLVGDLSSVLVQESADPNIASIEAKDSPPHSEVYTTLSDEIDRIIKLNKRIRDIRDRVQI